MPEFRAGSPEQVAYLDSLVDAGLLTRTGVHGVYARGETFERVRLQFDALVTRAAAPENPEPLLFPPLLPRDQLETSGYLASFPHLAGTVFAFEGDETRRIRAARARVAPRGLERVSADERDGARPGGLLPALSGGRQARPAAGRGPRARHRRRVRLPPRALRRSQPDADLPHARDRADRRARAGAAVARCMAHPGIGAALLARARDRARDRERSVLRPQRSAARLSAARPGAQVGAARTGARGQQDRDRVVELPPGPLRPHLRADAPPTASPRTHRASRSARSA